MAKVKGLFNLVTKKDKVKKEILEETGGWTQDLCQSPKNIFEGSNDWVKWIGYEFTGLGNEKQIEKYIVACNVSRWFFQAGNNGSDWATIHTVENAREIRKKGRVECEFENRKRFKMYRFLMYKGTDGKIYDFEMMERIKV